LEQLREYTTAEQKKLDEQRLLLQEDKRKFTEELTNRFKAMQEEHARLKEQLQKEAQERIATMEAETDVARHTKMLKKQEKLARKEQERLAQEVTDRERAEFFEREKFEAIQNLDKEHGELRQVLENQLHEKDHEIRRLELEVTNLRKQLADSHAASRNTMLEPLTAIMSSVFEAIRASSAHQSQGATEEAKTNDFLHGLLSTTANSLQKYAQQYATEEEKDALQ